MILKIGAFTINDQHVVYTERDTVSVPETITLHLSTNETLDFEGDEAVALAQHFEDQAQNINI